MSLFYEGQLFYDGLMKSVPNSVPENTQFLDLYTDEKTKFGSAAAILNLGMLFQIQEIVSVKINT